MTKFKEIKKMFKDFGLDSQGKRDYFLSLQDKEDTEFEEQEIIKIDTKTHISSKKGDSSAELA
jgi:hypothetical protein